MTAELVVVGLSHQTAPVALRERLAVVGSEVESHLGALVGLPAVLESALVSTCNRVEIYAATSDGELALPGLVDHLREQAAASGSGGRALAEWELDKHLYVRRGREAVHHLFRVTASLDSLVVGEPQILGQVKDAFELALKVRAAGPVLGLAFQRAFRVAREVRRDTGIARQTVSVSSVAVEMARQVWSGFEGRRVLLVGAGKMADLAARSLCAAGASVAVTNRTAAKAQELAQRLGCEVEDFADVPGALRRADIVITSTGARHPIFTAPLLERVQKARRQRPLVIIDIAVPRDVEPEVGAIDGVYLWDIDDLQKVAAQHMEGRRQEAERAEALVDREVSRYMATQRERAVGPTITALRARFFGVARTEAEKTLASLPALDERARQAVLAMADAIAAKLVHAPQVALKKGAAREDGSLLVGTAHALFDLPPIEPLGGGPGEGDAEAADDEAAAAGAPQAAQRSERR